MSFIRPLGFNPSGGFIEANEDDTLPATPVVRPYFDSPAPLDTAASFPVLMEATRIKLQSEKYRIFVSAEITGSSAGQGKQVGFRFDVANEERVSDTRDVVTANAWMLVSTQIVFDNTVSVVGGVDQGSKIFTINNVDYSFLQNGDTIIISGSTGNDGEYTIVSVVLNGSDTDIIVLETIPSAVADGNIELDIVFDFYTGVVAGNFTSKIRRRTIIAEKIVEQI